MTASLLKALSSALLSSTTYLNTKRRLRALERSLYVPLFEWMAQHSHVQGKSIPGLIHSFLTHDFIVLNRLVNGPVKKCSN